MPQKTVLITGCSEGGIGEALALEFQLRGLRVFATARDVSKMSALAAKGVHTLALDVTSGESIAAAVAAVSAATGSGGTLDVLVNNAGVNRVVPFLDSDVDRDFRAVLETNVLGVFAVTHAFLPLLIRAAAEAKAKGGGNGGSVVANINSINEVFCPAYQSAYNASKAAVRAMARTLQVELRPLGVRVVSVVTGAVRTRLFENSDPPAIPETSPYFPLRESIQERHFMRAASWSTGEEYARQVVADLLRPEPRLTLWRGAMANMAWVIGWLGWEGMLIEPQVKRLGLDKIQT